jgi:hypothetical protein
MKDAAGLTGLDTRVLERNTWEPYWFGKRMPSCHQDANTVKGKQERAAGASKQVRGRAELGFVAGTGV